MPAASSEKQYNNFTKGFITEASPLTFPDNSCLDIDNLVLERTGRVSRRLGLDFEVGYSLVNTGLLPATVDSSPKSFHTWNNPSGDTTRSIGVVRIGTQLWFVDMLQSSPSSVVLNGGSPITISGLSTGYIETSVISNRLILVSSNLDKPLSFSFNPVTTTISYVEISLQVRDIWGVADGLAVNQRPSTLSNTHLYNLRNNGWDTTISTTCGYDPITCTKDKISVYPSKADIWTLGKIGDLTSASFEKYDPLSMQKNQFDNAPAPTGKYIIDIYKRGASRMANAVPTITGLVSDIEQGRVSTISTFASRIFYSGVVSNVLGPDTFSPNYSGFIFFSQTVTSQDSLGKCFQEADPTSPTISDIIDTDGGTIQIPEATRIFKLLGTRTSLLVFAQNGVWEVFGDTGGFTATSYQISKISSVGTNSATSIIEVNGGILYWSKAGIYLLTQDQISGRYQAQNISISTIQTYFNELSSISRSNATGFYDEPQNRVRWIYNDQEDYGQGNLQRYNREIILDMTLNCFYFNTIAELDSDSPYIADYIEIPNYSSSVSLDTVLVGTDTVLVGTDEVIIQIKTNLNRSSTYGFLAIKGSTFTIAKYIDTEFLDWKSSDSIGKDSPALLITGFELYGDMLRRKQVPYLLVYMERTEDGFILEEDTLINNHPSSVLVQAQWNWANSAASGKWGRVFQVYRFKRNYTPSNNFDDFDIGDKVIVTKNKLRGMGKALSLKFTSEAGKDIRLLGWGTTLTGGSKP